MLGAPSDTNSNSLSGFQFTTIGKPPSLLGRISSKADSSQEPVWSPPSSPLSSPKMTISHGMPTTSRSSWFVNALSTQQEEATLGETPQISQSAARTVDTNPNTTSHHSLPARPPPTVIGKAEQHKPSKTVIAARTSCTSPSLPAQSSSSPSALRPTSSATPDRSPIVPPPSSVALAHPSHAASMSPASIDTALPQDDHEADMDESLRQAIARFEAGVAEIGRIQAETRRIVANFQDTGAHVHARAEGLAEQFRSRHANTERRVARANQRADELEKKLREAHNRIPRLEGENGNLRGETSKLRAELDQRQGQRDQLRGELDRLRGELGLAHGELDQVRGELERVRIQAGKDDARLNDALKTSHEAIKETELARARWAVVQKKLEDQLAAQKRDATAEKEALLAQIEELKRVVEDANRQVAVLVEEKRKLEVQIQTQVAQRKLSEGPQISCSRPLEQHSSLDGAEKIEGEEQTRDSARKPARHSASHQPQPDSHAPHEGYDSLSGHLSISPTTMSTRPLSQVSHGPPPGRTPTGGDGATQRRSRSKLLHLGDDGLFHPSMSPPFEPLLAVKDEDQDEVKAKIEAVEVASMGVSFPSHQHHLPTHEPRREQSLDYAPIQQELVRSLSMQQPAPDSITLSGSVLPHIEEQSPGSPVVSFGRRSPELAYPSRHSSYEPASPPREPSSVSFLDGPSAPPPAFELPQHQGSTSPQFPTSQRRGPMTPPLENAPSAQGKKLIIKRPGPQQAPLPTQTMDTTALPARPAQPPNQRSRSPPLRHVSDSWRPSRDHELRPQVRYSDESRDRHKRRRDDDTDTRQPVIRRPRLTPPPANDHYSPTHDHCPPPQPASRHASLDLSRLTTPRDFGDNRHHYQPPSSQEYQHRNAPPSDDERSYEPAPNGHLRRRVDHYSPPQQQRARYSPDVPTTGYAPEREARAAPIPDTEPPYPQMAPSLAERLQGNSDASVHDQPAASAQSKPIIESRPPRTNGGAPPARRQAKRRASRSPSPRCLPPDTSSQEPTLSASGSVPLLERFSDSKTPAPTSRGRGLGRGRTNRGRGGQPQQRPPVDRPQKSLEERLSMARNHEGSGGLMDRIQPR